MRLVNVRWFLPLLGLAAVASVSTPARAADDKPDPAAFPKGLWTLELAGSYAEPIRFSEDHFPAGTVGANYYLLNNLSLGVHLTGYGVDQPGSRDDGYGIGIEAFGRWHFLTLDRLTLYVDGGGGRVYFDPQTPVGGTNWNYSGRGGLGFTYKLEENVDLMGGARYVHFSNGDQFGRENNPSYDGVQYYVGLMFRM